jgi:hypothetical protein
MDVPCSNGSQKGNKKHQWYLRSKEFTALKVGCDLGGEVSDEPAVSIFKLKNAYIYF